MIAVAGIGICDQDTIRCNGRLRGGAQRFRRSPQDIPGQWTCSGFCDQDTIRCNGRLGGGAQRLHTRQSGQIVGMLEQMLSHTRSDT